MTSWHIGCVHMATFELFDFQRADCPNAWTLTGLYWTGSLDFDLNSAHDTILIRSAMNPVIFGPSNHIYYVGHWVTQTSIQVLSVRCCSLTYGLMSIQSDASYINWCLFFFLLIQHTYYKRKHCTFDHTDDEANKTKINSLDKRLTAKICKTWIVPSELTHQLI